MPNAPKPATTPAAPGAEAMLLKAIVGLAMALYLANAVKFSQLINLKDDFGHGPRWYPWSVLAVCLGALGCLLGIWKLRRWGVLGYILVTAVHNAVLVGAHAWNVVSGLAIPALVTLVALASLHRMR